ncbi:MAG TPA: hypothetical protein VGK10_02380 [Prolixibacteraceae bacterium]|jgi:hypothetical protein
MTPNNTNSLMEKLVHDFDLNPVYNDFGELLIGSIDVERVFNRGRVTSEILYLEFGEKFKKSMFFPKGKFTRKDYPSEAWYYHMSLIGLILLVKDYPGPKARRFMKRFIIAVEEQNRLLNNDNFILCLASKIHLKQASLYIRRLTR